MRRLALMSAAVVSALFMAAPASSATTDPDGKNRNVVVINEADEPVWEIYGSNVTRDTWEDDILRERVLPPGEQINIGFYDGTTHCQYDLKIKMRGGREIVHRNVNVCSLVRWRIRNNDDRLEY